jgi:hypothetical protein
MHATRNWLLPAIQNMFLAAFPRTVEPARVSSVSSRQLILHLINTQIKPKELIDGSLDHSSISIHRNTFERIVRQTISPRGFARELTDSAYFAH